MIVIGMIYNVLMALIRLKSAYKADEVGRLYIYNYWWWICLYSYFEIIKRYIVLISIMLMALIGLKSAYKADEVG